MRKAIALLLLTFGAHVLRAQVGLDWHRTYGFSDRHELLGGFTIDRAANTYLVGTMGGRGVTIKTDRFGNLIWSRAYPSVGDPDLYVEGRSIAVDRSGNVSITCVETRKSEHYLVTRWHVIKYDSEGTEQVDWLVMAPSDSKWIGNGGLLAIDSSDAVYSVFNANKEADKRAMILLNRSTTGGWQSEYFRPWGIGFEARDMRLDGDGNVYLFGIETFAGELEMLPAYGVMKVLPNSVMDWFDSLTPSDETLYKLVAAVDSTGNAFLGLDRGLGASHRALIVKYDSEGQREWSAEGPTNQLFSSLVPDRSGGVCALGRNVSGLSYSIEKYDAAGSLAWTNSQRDRWDLGTTGAEGSLYVANTYGDVAKFDSTGNLVWIFKCPTAGWHHVRGIAVDDSGFVYVGAEGSDMEVMRISPYCVYRPAYFEKWISGQVDTIRWRAPGWAVKNIKVVLNEGTASERTEGVAANVTEDSTFGWTIPDSLFSYRTRIIVENAADPSQKIQSEIFRVKPYHLTNFNPDSTYRPYVMELDAWGFANRRIEMWPESFWKSRFDYKGVDPFTDVQYSQTQAGGAFAVAQPDSFPDWVSFVNAFGINACYLDLENAVYNPVAVLLWARIGHPWRGSCYGISTSNAMVFLDRDRFLSLYPSFPLFAEPITVASDNFVIRPVTELYTHQFGNPAWAHNLFARDMTPNQTLEELRALLSEDVAPMRTLDFYNNRGTGGHSVVAYRMEREAPPSSNYRVRVYDSNYPGNSSAGIFIDTLASFGAGRWTTVFGYPGWGGDSALFLAVPAENHFFDVGLPKRVSSSLQAASDFAVPDSLLEVLVAAGTDIVISDGAGKSTGLVDGALKTDIPGSCALSLLDGLETPPYGYLLNSNAFLLRVDSAQSERIGLTLRSGNQLFSYDREDADPDETDFIGYDGSMKLANPDPAVKRARFISVASEPSQAKLFALREVLLQQNDSVGIENIGESNLRFRSYGSARTYDLEINHAAPGGLGRFVASGISVGANTAHTIVPDWTDLDQIPVTILIDESNDGSIDDTLEVANTASDVGGHGLQGTPTECELFQNYPNPFNLSTTIRYGLPEKSMVNLSVYNLLGQEVATVFQGEQEAGYHEVTFDATEFSSGVYIYRLVAGDFVATRKLTLVK